MQNKATYKYFNKKQQTTDSNSNQKSLLNSMNTNDSK